MLLKGRERDECACQHAGETVTRHAGFPVPGEAAIVWWNVTRCSYVETEHHFQRCANDALWKINVSLQLNESSGTQWLSAAARWLTAKDKPPTSIDQIKLKTTQVLSTLQKKLRFLTAITTFRTTNKSVVVSTMQLQRPVCYNMARCPLADCDPCGCCRAGHNVSQFQQSKRN